MSITDVKLVEKEKVFLRLIENENISDSCSKAGISLSSRIITAIKNSDK